MSFAQLLGMLHLALTMKWINASSSDVPAAKVTGSRKRSPSPGRAAAAEGMPKDIMKAVELVMDWNKMELVEILGWFREKKRCGNSCCLEVCDLEIA